MAPRSGTTPHLSSKARIPDQGRGARPDADSLLELLDSLTGAVARVDRDERILYLNAAAARWLGVPPSEAVGQTLATVLDPARYALARPALAQLARGREQRLERTVLDPHGDVLYYLIQGVPQLDPAGQPAGFTALAVDVTRRVLAEAALGESTTYAALLAERSRLVTDINDGVIQHLFASGLALRAAAASDPEVAEQVGRALAVVDTAIADLRTAIHKLTDVSAVSADDAITHLVSTAVGWLGFRPSVTRHGSTEELPPQVTRGLVAALTELLSNVARHAHAHEVDVVVSTAATEVVLGVIDDGVGLPADLRPGPGLGVLGRRAEELGGAFSLRAREPRGVEATWRVPLGAG